MSYVIVYCSFFFFQAEDGIRDLVRSRGLGDVYKRQVIHTPALDVLLIERADKPGYWQSVTGSLDAPDEPLSLIHI